MEIPLDLARTLLAVVDAGTMDAAAQQLRLTPSAVSQRVKALEQQLGRVLLVRSKPVGVTDAGAAIVRLARQISVLEHDALAAVGIDDDAGGVTSVALAVNADSLGTWFLPAIARVAATHPVTFELFREDQDHTAELLEAGLVMAAVTSRATPIAGCTSAFLGSMRYRPVATAAFSARWLPTSTPAAELGAAPVVDFDRSDDLQAEFLHSIGVTDAPPRHFVPASNDFASAVKRGLGWGMLPEFQIGDGLETGELVELAPGRHIDVPLYWQQWNLRSPLLTAIAEVVAAEARTALTPPAGQRETQPR